MKNLQAGRGHVNWSNFKQFNVKEKLFFKNNFKRVQVEESFRSSIDDKSAESTKPHKPVTKLV